MSESGIPWADIFILGIMLISGFLAFYRGFVREVLAIISWVLAAVITLLAFAPLQPVARDLLGEGIVADAVLGLVLFLTSLIILTVIVSVIISAVHGRDEEGLGPGPIDRSAGFLFGLARGFLLVVVLAWFWVYWLTDDATPGWLEGAMFQGPVEDSIALLNALTTKEGDPGETAPSDEQSAEQNAGDPAKEGYSEDERESLDDILDEADEEPAPQQDPEDTPQSRTVPPHTSGAGG